MLFFEFLNAFQFGIVFEKTIENQSHSETALELG